MKAIVYQKNNHADPLVLCEVEKPIPADNQVLIRIHATSVNAADYRSMKLGIIPKSKIFGTDVAGRVEAVGKNTSRFSVGDEVFGDLSGCGFGGFAEYVAVPETPLSLKSADVSYEAAAAIPMSAVTALQGLRNSGNIQPGHKVLIYGAGGGVGTFAIQLAKLFGGDVTAVCSGKNAELAGSLGADQIIDYQKSDFSRTAMRFDRIMAINGSLPISTYMRLLAPGGICVVVGGALSQVFKTLLFGKLLSFGSRKIRVLQAIPRAEDQDFIINLVSEGKVKPVIDRRYTLQETNEAFKYLSEGHAQGKVILSMVE